MAVLGCRSLLLVILIRTRRWKNLSFSHGAKIFENVCVMNHQEIMEQLNTIKRHPGRIFTKFEKDDGIVLKSRFLCVLLGFLLNFQAIPIMNHYSMVHDNLNTLH